MAAEVVAVVAASLVAEVPVADSLVAEVPVEAALAEASEGASEADADDMIISLFLPWLLQLEACRWALG